MYGGVPKGQRNSNKGQFSFSDYLKSSGSSGEEWIQHFISEYFCVLKLYKNKFNYTASEKPTKFYIDYYQEAVCTTANFETH